MNYQKPRFAYPHNIRNAKIFRQFLYETAEIFNKINVVCKLKQSPDA